MFTFPISCLVQYITVENKVIKRKGVLCALFFAILSQDPTRNQKKQKQKKIKNFLFVDAQDL